MRQQEIDLKNPTYKSVLTYNSSWGCWAHTQSAEVFLDKLMSPPEPVWKRLSGAGKLEKATEELPALTFDRGQR